MRLRLQGLSWQVVGDEVVVLDLQGSTYLKTNGTGATLWQLLAEERSRDELAAELAECYAIGRGQAETDVDAFLHRLRELNLLNLAERSL